MRTGLSYSFVLNVLIFTLFSLIQPGDAAIGCTFNLAMTSWTQAAVTYCIRGGNVVVPQPSGATSTVTLTGGGCSACATPAGAQVYSLLYQNGSAVSPDFTISSTNSSSPSGAITINDGGNGVNANTYPLMIIGTAWDACNSVYATTTTTSVNFTVTFVECCNTTTITVTPAFQATLTISALQTYNAGTQLQTLNWPDSVSTTKGNLDGQTLCGPKTLTLVSTTKTWLTVDNTTKTVKVDSTLANDTVGSPFAVTIKQCLVNFPTICSSNQNMMVTITACSVTAITCTNAASYTGVTNNLFLDNVTYSYTFPMYTQTPACGYTPTYSMTLGGTALPTKGFTLTGTAISALDTVRTDAGSYIAVFKIQLGSCMGVCVNTAITTTYVWQDLCTTSSLIASTVNAMTTCELLTPASTQTVAYPKDTVSNYKGSSDGYTYCGTRTCTVDTNTILSFTYPTITLLSTSNTDNNASPYTAKLTCQLSTAAYAVPSVFTAFTVTVNDTLTCAQSVDVPTITPQILSNKTYIWTQPAGSYNIPIFSVSSTLSICTAGDIVYTMSVIASSGGSTAFLTFDSVNMLVNWLEIINRVTETFTITLTAKISNLNTGSPFLTTQSFQLVASPPTCAQSLDVPTILPPTLSNQTYIWTQPAGSYNIPLFSVSSTLSICTASDIVYTMSVIASSGGSTAFLTFDSVNMLVNWLEIINRVTETFTITLTAKISNLNTGSPFLTTQSFQLVASPPTCAQSLDVPTILPPTLSNQTYIWTQPVGSYNVPLFSVSSTLSICTASDIVYTMSVIASSGGSTAFLTFDSVNMLVNWLEIINRVTETFTITLTAKISNLNTGSPFLTTQSFQLVAAAPTCAQSLDVPTILPPTLSNQTYIWTQPAGSYNIPLISVSSTLSICTASDIVYTMSVIASSGGSTAFLTFDSINMLVNWLEIINRVTETFTINLTAKISNLNTGSPFLTTQSFQLVASPPTCAQSLDFPTILPPTLSNQTYIWTQPAGSYNVPLFSVSSTLSICTASDIVYTMSVIASSGGSTAFLTFDSINMLVNWLEIINRVTETFTINLTAKISNLNTGSPFISTSTFQLFVKQPQTCLLSSDVIFIEIPILLNQTYIWGQSTGSYLIPIYNVSSTQCDQNDIVYSMTIVSQYGGSSQFITLNQDLRLIEWQSNQIGGKETFTINLKAMILNSNIFSPFVASSSFKLFVTSPSNITFDLVVIMASFVKNQTYFLGSNINSSVAFERFEVISSSELFSNATVRYTIQVKAENFNHSVAFINFNSKNLTVEWGTNNSINQGTYQIKIIGIINNLLTGENYIGSLKFYLTINPTQKQTNLNSECTLQNITNSTIFLTNGTIASNNYYKTEDIDVAPIAKIGKISRQGEVNITFSQWIYSPEIITMFTWNNLTEDQVPPLRLSILVSNEKDVDQFNFTYKIVNFTGIVMTLQLDFANPLYVTRSIEDPDILQINFTAAFFFTIHCQVLAENSTRLRAPLPWFIPEDPKVTVITTAVLKIVEYSLSAQYFLNLFLQISLQQFWQLIETQQIIILLPLFNMRLPGNAVSYFSQILQIAMLNVLPVGKFYELCIQFTQTDPINENFESIGFETTNFLKNIGSMIFGLCWLIVLSILVIVLNLIKFCRNYKIKKQLTEMLIWKYPITLMIEQCSTLVLCSFMSVKNPIFTLAWDAVSQCFAIIFGISVVICPIIFVTVMYVKFPKLKEKKIKDQIGLLYQNLRLSRGRCIIFVPFMYLTRRILLAAVIVFQDNFIAQIITLQCLGLFNAIIYLDVRPFDDPNQNRKEIFNEIVIMGILYCTMCFTEFISNPISQYYMGYVCCMLNTLHIFVNLMIIYREFFNGIKMRCMKYRKFRNNKKKVAQFALMKQKNKAEEPAQTILAPVQEAGSSQEESSSSQVSQGPEIDLEINKQSDAHQSNTVAQQTQMTFNEIQEDQTESNFRKVKPKEPVQDILEVTLDELEEIHRKKEQIESNNSILRDKLIVQQISQLEKDFKTIDKAIWNDQEPQAKLKQKSETLWHDQKTQLDFSSMDEALWNDQKTQANFKQNDQALWKDKKTQLDFSSMDQALWNDQKTQANFKQNDQALWKDKKTQVDFNQMDEALWKDQKPKANFQQKDERTHQQKQQMEQKQTVQRTKDMQDQVIRKKQEAPYRLDKIEKQNDNDKINKYIIDQYWNSPKKMEVPKNNLQIVQDLDIQFQFDQPPVQQPFQIEKQKVPYWQKATQPQTKSMYLTTQQKEQINRHK